MSSVLGSAFPLRNTNYSSNFPPHSIRVRGGGRRNPEISLSPARVGEKGDMSASSLLEKARSQAQLYASRQLHNTAIFWADKALSLSSGEASDLATMASLLQASGQHRRALHALLSSPHLPHSSGLRYLAAKSHVSLQEWEEALLLLRPPAEEEEEEMADSVSCPQLGDVIAASLLLQGQAHEGLGSLQEAAGCYREALRADVFCSEALERLCQHHSLTAEEEKSVLTDLPFRRQCSAEEEKMLKILYSAKLRHSHKCTDLRVLCTKEATLCPLATNADISWNVAHRLYMSRNVHSCYELTSRELTSDPFHPGLLQLHLLCCVEEGKTAELFALGHKLVGDSPSSALAWFAVSCYYLAIRNHQSARKYLTKVLSLDANFAFGHLAFGASFASEGEHDQAISAFSKAARIMKGSQIPLMQLGREYYITGSTATAVRFMRSALAIAPSDPTLLQEVGVILTGSRNHEKAVKYFHQSLACLRSADPHMSIRDWEPVYNNLAHAYRKLKKFDLALEMHHKALSLSPKEPTTLTAIAFIHLLKGDHERAVDYCSRSLQMKREDPFTVEVFKTATEELVSEPLELGSPSKALHSPEPESDTLKWGQQQSGSGEGMTTS